MMEPGLEDVENSGPTEIRTRTRCAEEKLKTDVYLMFFSMR